MNTDIRIELSFKGHRKRKKLKLLLGPGSTDFLIDLWLNTAVNHPKGILTGMNEIDIALEAGWEEDPGKFVDALLECRLLDRLDDGTYQLHDWEDHQPWVVHAEERSKQAAEAARIMWDKKRGKSKPKAGSKRGACGEHAGRNAPSPSPSPSPIPYKLSKYLFDCILDQNPNSKLHACENGDREKTILHWYEDIEKLIRIDKQDPEIVEKVIKFATHDKFWKGNILSGAKLREKWDTLVVKADGNTDNDKSGYLD